MLPNRQGFDFLRVKFEIRIEFTNSYHFVGLLSKRQNLCSFNSANERTSLLFNRVYRRLINLPHAYKQYSSRECKRLSPLENPLCLRLRDHPLLLLARPGHDLDFHAHSISQGTVYSSRRESCHS